MITKIGGGWVSIARICTGEVWVDVEVVLEHPCGVARWVVERGEVVVVVLDLGSLDLPVAEPGHHVLDLPRGARDQVQVPRWMGGRARQGDVDPVARQLRFQLSRVELCGAALEQLLESLAHPVGAAANAAAFLRRQLGDATQDHRQLGFAAEVADPQLLQLGAARDGPDSGRRLQLDLLEPIEGHWAASRMRSDDIRSQAMAAAAATLSDSAAAGRSGMVRRKSHQPSSSSGIPPLSEPRQTVATGPSAAIGSPPWAISAARGAGVSPIEARSSGWPKTDPMLARTAFGPNGSAHSGPRTTVPPISACAERTIAPTLPGSATPCRYTQGGFASFAQLCSQTAIARVPEPSAETSARRSGSISSPPSALPAVLSRKRGSAPAARPASTRSSPSVTNRPSRSRCLRSRSLRINFSFSLWGLEIICIGFGSVEFSPRTRSNPGQIKNGP